MFSTKESSVGRLTGCFWLADRKDQPKVVSGSHTQGGNLCTKCWTWGEEHFTRKKICLIETLLQGSHKKYDKLSGGLQESTSKALYCWVSVWIAAQSYFQQPPAQRKLCSYTSLKNTPICLPQYSTVTLGTALSTASGNFFFLIFFCNQSSNPF